MSDQSLESLLAWLREESRMLGWDMIIAIERDKANLLLRHEYMARFDRGEYLEPISGSEEVGSNYWRGVLHDFVFDAPRLMFQTIAAPSPTDPDRTLEEALLTMDLMSGALFSMENDNVTWRVRRLQAFDTLQANKLYLHLEIPQTLAIEADGAIKLDFRFSQNFEMALTGDAEFNEQLSIAFRTLFHELEDARRMYTLLVLPAAGNTSGPPGKIKLYSQANPDASIAAQVPGYGSGALLIMASRDGAGGSGPATGFKYLIPDDLEKNYSMLVMFSHEEVLRLIDADTAVLTAIMRKFGWEGPIDRYFDITPGSHELWRAVFREGNCPVGHEVEFLSDSHPGPEIPGWLLMLEWDNPWFNVEGQTHLQHSDNGYLIRVDTTSECRFFVNKEVYRYWGVDNVAAVVRGDLSFQITIEEDDLRLSRTNFTGDGSGIPPALLSEHNPCPGWPIDYTTLRDFINALPRAPRRYEAVKYTIQAHFGEFGSLHPSVLEFMASSFDPAFKLQDLISPLDTACFGSINPSRTSFEITPWEQVIAPEQLCTFTIDVPGSIVDWDVSNIDPASSAPPGKIDDGIYHAPALDSIVGNYTRVRVTATEYDSTAKALVTVVAQPLTINPLVATCEADKSGGAPGGVDHLVDLVAGAMGEEGTRITWSIKNQVEGESGSLQPGPDGRTCTFTAHPALTTKAYVLDEVQVQAQISKDGQTITSCRSALVLASHAGFGLNIYIAKASIDPNELTLLARLKDDFSTHVSPEWRLAEQSPGSIDKTTGTYRADAASTEKFAVIFAADIEGGWGDEGYMILPLPFLDFPEELILLSLPDETDASATAFAPGF